MSKTHQIHAPFVLNADGISNAVTIPMVMAEVKAAGAEYAALQSLSEAQSNVVDAAFEQGTEDVAAMLDGLAEDADLDPHQIIGMRMAFGYGLIVDSIDQMRANQHPLARAAYLSTMLRIFQFNTLAATAIVTPDKAHPQVKENVKRMVTAAIDNPIDIDVIHADVKAGLAAMKTPRTPSGVAVTKPVLTDDAKKVLGDTLGHLEALIGLMPEGTERDGAIERLAGMRDKFKAILPDPEPLVDERPVGAQRIMDIIDSTECPTHGKNCPTRKSLRSMLADAAKGAEHDDDAPTLGMIEVEVGPNAVAEITRQLREATGMNLTEAEVTQAMADAEANGGAVIIRRKK